MVARILSALRDVLLVGGVLFICVLLLEAREQRERDRAVRLMRTNQAIEKLDALYRTAVFNDSDNKGVYHQIFRQNEIAIEYQKLLLLRDLQRTDNEDLGATPVTLGLEK